jgi:hypothetical protein
MNMDLDNIAELKVAVAVGATVPGTAGAGYLLTRAL